MAENGENVCFKCGSSTAGKLMRCRECQTCFCNNCFPPMSLDTGVIADKIDMCPKCDSRSLDYLG